MGQPKDTRFTEALRRAVMREVEIEGKEGPQRAIALDCLAQTLIGRGIAGDVTAIKEIFDRLEGKAKQTLEAEVTTMTLADVLMAAASKQKGEDNDQEDKEPE